MNRRPGWVQGFVVDVHVTDVALVVVQETHSGRQHTVTNPACVCSVGTKVWINKSGDKIEQRI